jgi:hypothetical protein
VAGIRNFEPRKHARSTNLPRKHARNFKPRKHAAREKQKGFGRIRLDKPRNTRYRFLRVFSFLVWQTYHVVTSFYLMLACKSARFKESCPLRDSAHGGRRGDWAFSIFGHFSSFIAIVSSFFAIVLSRFSISDLILSVHKIHKRWMPIQLLKIAQPANFHWLSLDIRSFFDVES